MDWHTAEAATMQKKAGDKPLLGVEEFEKMAEHCQKSMKTLQQAAVTRVEGGSGPEPVLKALDEVQSKCNDCHSHLEGIAPDVWGTGYK
jgi:cytochrome c556